MVSECVLSIIPLIQSNASPFKSCQPCHSLASTRHWTLEFLWRLQADFDHDLAPFDRIYDGFLDLGAPLGFPTNPHQHATVPTTDPRGEQRMLCGALFAASERSPEPLGDLLWQLGDRLKARRTWRSGVVEKLKLKEEQATCLLVSWI